MAKKRRAYTPKYPYTLLAEALDAYRAEVFRDDEVRNKFLAHVQPLVRHCVGRTIATFGGPLFGRVDDVVGYVNVRMLESWLPAYLSSKSKAARVREAVRYLSKSIRGYVLTYVKDNYDPRLMSFDLAPEPARSFGRRADREEIDAAYQQMLEEYVALRPRPDLDLEVVRKLVKYLVWEEYRRIDGVPG